MSPAEWVQTLLYLNAGLTFVCVIMTLLVSLRLYGLWKKKTYALIASPDRSTVKVLRIDPSKPFFNWKDGSYNITEPWLFHASHKYLLYVKGKSDPVDIVSMENSRLKADVYKVVLENEALNAMNKPQGLFANLDAKKIIIGAVIVIGFVFLLQSGALSP